MGIFLQTLDEAWPGSTKITSWAEQLTDVAGPSYSWPMTILVLVALFYCIFFFNRIALASSISLQAFFSSSDKIHGICTNQSSLSAVNTASVLCLPVVVMLLYTKGWTSLSLDFLCLAFIVFLIVRSLAIALVTWYKGGQFTFDLIRTSGKVILIVATLLSIPAFVIPRLFGPQSSGFAKSYFLALVTFCFAFYCIRACKHLLDGGFSIFFCFLYLCAFEFLPAGLLISAIISL